MKNLMIYVNPLGPKPNEIDFFLYGKNKLGVQIVPKRLVKIFGRYGMNYSAAKLTEYPAESSSVNHSSPNPTVGYSGSRIK